MYSFAIAKMAEEAQATSANEEEAISRRLSNWSTTMELLLLRQADGEGILSVAHGEKADAWKSIADNLKDHIPLITSRNARDKVIALLKRLPQGRC
jgi:hypothetical protein